MRKPSPARPKHLRRQLPKSASKFAGITEGAAQEAQKTDKTVCSLSEVDQMIGEEHSGSVRSFCRRALTHTYCMALP